MKALTTKSELIALLEQIPGDPEVTLSVFGHNTFGGTALVVELVKLHYAFQDPQVVLLIRDSTFPSASGYRPVAVKD